MSEWEDVVLGDVATIQIGGTPSRDVDAYWATDFDSGFPWVSIADLKERVITDTKERITVRGVANSNVKPISAGTLLMSFKLSIGRAALAGVDLYTNEAIAAIIPKDKRLHPGLLYFVLPPVTKNAITDTAVKGSTLNKSSLGKLTFKVPADYHIQEKIACILQTIDQSIEKTEALIEKYQQIKAGLMHDLFTRGVTADGQLRPPREQAPELYQHTPIGWIPKEWEPINLGKYIEFNLYGPRFDARDYDENGNVKTIRGTDFSKDGCIIYSQVPVARLPLQKISRHILKAGDVVVVTTADCGLTAVFEEQEFYFIPSAYAVKYRFSENVSPHYIKYFMQTSMAKRQVNKYVRQGTLGNLPGSDLLRFLVGLANLHEQKAIVKRLDAVHEKIVAEQKTLDKLVKQKSGLMHDLLTGKVPVQLNEPNTEAKA